MALASWEAWWLAGWGADVEPPIITIVVPPDPDAISEQPTKDTSTLVWRSDEDLIAYRVMAVADPDDPVEAGSLISSAAGSTHTFAGDPYPGGAVAAGEDVTTTIKGTDLKNASPGDADKIVKVFGEDAAGNWSE